MSTFNEADHPRNHPTGKSRFSDKPHSEPEAGISNNRDFRPPEEIAQDVITNSKARGVYAPAGDFTDYGIAATAAREAQRESALQTLTELRAAYESQLAKGEPDFAPEDGPDKYRDLWTENMPRVSGSMYFAIPGEQPIHIDDEQARHILAYLSEQNR